jgi:hypothetical protein
VSKQPPHPAAMAAVLVLAILLGALAHVLPYLATGETRCLVLPRSCPWWVP